MKKFLVCSIIACSAIGFSDEGGSGFFVGVDTGYSVEFSKVVVTQQGQVTTTNNTLAPSQMNFGAKVGYNYYFLSFLGVRGYLDYQYGLNTSNTSGTQVDQGQTNTNTNEKTKNTFHQITFNVDALVNFVNLDTFQLGAYAGVGLGYATINHTTETIDAGVTTIINTKPADGFVLPVNVGLSIVAGGHHRLDFGVRIPTIALSRKIVTGTAPDTTTTDNTYRYLITTIGYSYNF